MARAAGKDVADDLIPEFARVVNEAQPRWWLMENVAAAYAPLRPCFTLPLNNRWIGGEQNRLRVFWSNLPLSVPGDALEPAGYRPTAAMSIWKDGRQYGDHTRQRFKQVKADQHLPDNFDLPGFKVREKIQAVVNGVPLPMGRAVAKAVREALER